MSVAEKGDHNTHFFLHFLELRKAGDRQKGNAKEKDVRMSNIVAAKGVKN